ncbi:hypothetical protein NL676_023327 [Syzygium grande]|nr:hypothetical protein NL676_023327 [Syzygium grande]
MASNSNESDEKLRGSVMRFSDTWKAYKKSQSTRRKRTGIPSGHAEWQCRHECHERRQAPSHPVEQSRTIVAGDQVALVRSRRENPLPKSRLSVSSGSGSREYHHREQPPSSLDNDDMPPLEYDLPPQSSSYYYQNPEYYYSPHVDNFFRHFREDAPGSSEYQPPRASYDHGHSSENKSLENCVVM